MMTRSPRLLPRLALTAWLLLPAACMAFGQTPETFWPPPTVPAGTNPTTMARPRLEWLERVEQNFARTRGKDFDLIFDGDSITDGWQSVGKDVWAAAYGGRRAVDFGIGGDRIENVLWRLKQGQVDGMHPKLIVLMIGTNNLGGATVDQIAEGIGAVVADCRRRCPDAHLLLLGIFPRYNEATQPVRQSIIQINQKIAHLDDGAHVTYLDIGAKFLTPDGTLTAAIMPDFLHPSAEGYRIWAEAIAPIVDKYVPAKTP
jgi:lysophospholipase L1-like esterase